MSDLEQLHLPPPPPPPQALVEGPPLQPQPSPLRPMEELPPPPEEPVSLPEREASTDICAFCHKTVSPRELAVEAMKRQYHAQCFTCRVCRRQLAGQSFYQKDGRPLCEPCYQDTLEKCGKCGEGVREHIIRALGQAFHPTCFTCVTCARCIGDESFALDSQNEVYCLDDFYRKFAPVCSICENPIIPRDGKDAFKIECMGRNFHENCYRCEDTLEKCGKCGEGVREHIIRALGQAFHPTCFTCVTCARCIGDESFALDSQNEVYCLDDFYRKFAPVCSICENPIIPRDGKDAFKIECMGRNFHENCYRCEDCRILLSVEPTDQGCYPLNNRLFCKPCHVKRSAASCC